MSYVLLRRVVADGESVTEDARTLRGLWPLLTKVAVVDYESVGGVYRSGGLDRLWGHTHSYFADQRALPRKRANGAALTSAQGGPEVEDRKEVCAVLIVPHRTSVLDADVKDLGLRWEDLGDGYLRVHGGAFTLYVVDLEVVAVAEGDEVLQSFSRRKVISPEVRRFWSEVMASEEATMAGEELEGREEVMKMLSDCEDDT